MASKTLQHPLLSSRKKSYASYWRLLTFVKPYRKKLITGILAGLLASGSLFGGLMILPQMIATVNPASARTEGVAESGKLRTVSASSDQKNTPAEQNLLQKKVEDADKVLQKIFPASWKIRTYCREGVVSLSIAGKELIALPAEQKDGKMTWQFFSVFAVCFILLWVFRNFFIYINHYCMRYVGTRVITDLRILSFRKLINQSYGFFGTLDMGEMISRTTSDTATMEAAVSNSIADATRCPLELIACIAAIIMASLKFQNWMLLLILFIGIPFILLPMILISQKIRRIFRNSLYQISMVIQRMHEVLSGILVVKAYHTEEREDGRFSKTNEAYFKTVIRSVRYQLMMQPMMEVICVASTLVFLIFSYSQGVTLIELVQLLAPCFLAYNPIKSLSKVVNNVQRSMAAADRYFQLLDTDTSLKEKKDPVIFREFKDRICLEKVSFAYEKHQILDKVDLTIPKGQMVAVVGSTGSGKTTIANLLARLYDVSDGKVTIDGVDVRDFQISSLRNQIGIVTQDAILFNETIADNIAYGKIDATREEIIQAAKMANAHSFIVDGRHPDGYDTVVGEKGFLLSGGEKQRISIARAILRNPPILILDEATSALDTVTEKLVQEALTQVMAKRTVFAIAHRLSTIKHANTIIVLDQGRIIESGTHEELLAKNGTYKKLYDTQFSKDE